MSNKTALQIVRSACLRVGVNRPSTASGATDLQTQQMWGLLSFEGQQLCARFDWQACTLEKTFTTIASTDQGAFVGGAQINFADSDAYDHVISDTLWDRTTKYAPRPTTGDVWQGEVASGITGPYGKFRIRGGNLIIYPTPAAGLTLAFEYKTKNWVAITATADPTLDAFSDDAQYSVLDWQIIEQGLVWRWLKTKGFEYAEDFNTYEAMVADAMTRDQPRRAVSQEGRREDSAEPGIMVPRDSWNI